MLIVVSALHGGVDSTTVLNICATLVPYIAMIAVLGHVVIRPRTARDLVTIACASGAVLVVLTIVKKALEGALGQRLQTFAFGAGPETGVVLAPLLLLVPAMSVKRSRRSPRRAVCRGATPDTDPWRHHRSLRWCHRAARCGQTASPFGDPRPA